MVCDNDSRGVELVIPNDPHKAVVIEGKNTSTGIEATGVLMPLAKDR